MMDYQFPQSHISNEDVQEQLIEPMEMFIVEAATSAEAEEQLKRLSQSSEVRPQCGKLFKMGDPTYSCRDCGHDPTCVLCYACFKNSQHRFCRYKMSTSNGGGYCDCGDSEAWSNHVHCSEHLRGVEGAKGKDPLAQIPVNIQVGQSHLIFLCHVIP